MLNIGRTNGVICALSPGSFIWMCITWDLGKVTAAAVAEAHAKDAAVIKTHKEAHGLVPQHIMQVKPGEK